MSTEKSLPAERPSVPLILFRTESYSGSGVRAIADVLQYEIAELRNKDIPRYVLEHYTLPEKLKSDLETILGQDPADEYPYLSDDKGHGVADPAALRDVIERTVEAVSATLGQNIMNGRRYNALALRYALWLAPLHEVSEHYAADGGPVQAYNTASRTLYNPAPVVLSDLGAEGVLLAFVDEPRPLPEPVRYELATWPDSQAFMMGLPFAVASDHPDLSSPWLFPQDYILPGPDGTEPVLSEPYYRIGWPQAQKAEEAFRTGCFQATDLLHAYDSRDVFVSGEMLSRLVDPEGKHSVEVILSDNFLHEGVMQPNVEVTPTQPAEHEGAWMHFFEYGGRHGYASNYGYGTNIRKLEDGTTDDEFKALPDDNPHKKIYLACKALGLPCDNITFND